MTTRMLSLVVRPPARIWRTMDNAADIVRGDSNHRSSDYDDD